MGDIISIKTGQGATAIPNAVIDDPWLSYGAKGLYTMAKRADEAGKPLLGSELEPAVQGYIQELIRGGYIAGPEAKA
jgi:hypothetical protein